MAKMDNSTVLELGEMGDDESDYEVDLSNSGRGQKRDASQEKEGMMGDVKSQVTKGMASYFIEEGRQRAKRAFSVYGNIDVLRPYFDVEPHQVRLRLLQSLVPRKPSSGSSQEKVPRELYGPTMVIFTLIALLLFQMKSSGHVVAEGTLMGSAFGVCFGYWFGVASLVWVMAYVCNTKLTAVQILSLLGYALFGHCVVIFAGTIFHPVHSHFYFYALWAVVGGLSTLKMVSVLLSRTVGQSQRVIICSCVAALHLLFLLYLHFAYHSTVEEIASVLDQPVQPQMGVPLHSMDSLVVPGADAVRTAALVSLSEKADDAAAPVAIDAVVDAVRTATHSVQRVVREATKHGAAAANDTVVAGGSKLIQSLGRGGLKQAANATVLVAQHALKSINGTKLTNRLKPPPNRPVLPWQLGIKNSKN